MQTEINIPAWGGYWIFLLLITLIAMGSPLAGLGVLSTTLVLGLLLLRPEWSLYLVTGLLLPAPCFNFQIFDFPLSIAHLAIILCLVSWSLAILLKTRTKPASSPGDVPLFLFWTWALLSLLWSHNFTNGLHDSLRLSLGLASFFLITSLARNRQVLERIMAIMIALGVVNSLLTIAYLYSDFALICKWTFGNWLGIKIAFWLNNLITPMGRAMGFATPHDTAATMIIPLSFSAMFFFTLQDKKKRFLAASAFLIMFAACTATMAKGPILSILVGIFFVFLHLRPLRGKIFTASLLLLLLTLFCFALTRFHGLSQDTAQLGVDLQVASADPDRMTSLENRITAWSIGFKKLWDTGGLGTGIGGFNQYLPYHWIDGAHPVTLFDLGLIGLTIYILLLISAYLHFKNNICTTASQFYKRRLLCFQGGLVAILLSWFVSFSYTHVYLWYYLGIGYALSALASSATPNEDKALPQLFGEKELLLI